MIQTFTIHTPVEPGSVDSIVATITASLNILMQRHPALRGAAVDASTAGVLELSLKVQGTDRWKTQRAARTIASMVLRKVKIDPNLGKVASVHTAPSARSLTKEQGRNVTNAYTPKRDRQHD